MRRWIGIAIIVIVLAGGAWWWLRGRQQPQQEEELATAQVMRGDLRVTVAATGVLEPLTTVEVKSRSGGEIKKMYVEAGDTVKAGQLIAQLDPTDLQSQVDQARAQVRSSSARVAQSRYTAQAQAEQADAQVAEAEASLASARARLRQAETQLEQTRASSDQEIRQAQARLNAAQARLEQAKTQARTQPELSAAEIRQAEASLVRARQDLAVLEAGNRPQEIAQARSRVEEARAVLDNATAELRRQEQLFEKGFVSEQALDTARRAERTARAQLASAQESLALIEEGPRQEEIERARAAVRQAEAALEAARAQQSQIEIREQDLRSAEASVTEAEAALATAQANRRQIDIREQEVAAARQAVEQAEAALERAKSAHLTTQARREDIQSALADLERSQAQLDDVQYSFRNTTIVAPRDGVVLTKHVEEGTVVPAGTAALAQGTAIVTLADITEMYVMAEVDEVDISRVAVGQDVEINVETLPNVKIAGRVEKIFPQGQEEQNVIYFPVRIKVLDLHPDLRPGMTVDVSILTAERKDVLLVPDAAIDRSGGETHVEVLTDPKGEPERRKVEVGVTDWQLTEIKSGLQVGETVVLPSAAAATGTMGMGADAGDARSPQDERARSARRATRMIGRGRR